MVCQLRQGALLGKGGVVRDPAAWRLALERVGAAVGTLGWRITGLVPSSIRGASGNVEFLALLEPSIRAEDGAEGDAGLHTDLIDAALDELVVASVDTADAVDSGVDGSAPSEVAT
jgi:hypothetical protein